MSRIETTNANNREFKTFIPVDICRAVSTNYEPVESTADALGAILQDFSKYATAKYVITVKDPDSNRRVVLKILCHREKVLAEYQGSLDQVIEELA